MFTYWGGDRKKGNGHRERFQKRNNFKISVVTPTFYVMKWKWQAYSTRDLFLVVRKSYLIAFELKQKKAVRDANSAVATILLLKTFQSVFCVTFYHVV